MRQVGKLSTRFHLGLAGSKARVACGLLLGGEGSLLLDLLSSQTSSFSNLSLSRCNGLSFALSFGG